MHIYYEVTNQCNLNCEYCYNSSGERKQTELELEQFFVIIDYMKAKLSLSSITFSGGEPLLRRDIFYMIDYCISKGIQVYLITNGTLLNDSMIHKLESLKHIIISLHSNYKNNINFEMLKTFRNKVSLSFSVVLNKDNFNSIDDYCEFAKKIRIPISFRVQKARGRGNNDKLLNLAEIECADEFIRKQVGDPFVSTNCLVDMQLSSCCYFSNEYDEYTMLPNGDICLCQVLPRKYIVGNALDKLWKNNLERAKNELYNDWLKYKENICSVCFMKEVCRGICPGEIVFETEKCLQCNARCRTYLRKAFGGIHG